MENELRLEQLKIKLESEIDGLARVHPNIVNPLEQELDQTVEKEKSIRVGKKIDTYSIYRTVRSLFYTEADPEDRVAKLLSVCLKCIKKPIYSDNLKGRLEKLRDRKTLTENKATSERIELWIKKNQSGTEPIPIPHEFITIPLLFHHVEGREFSSFFSQLGRIVFDNIEAGLSAGEVVGILEKQKFTTMLIGTTTPEKEF